MSFRAPSRYRTLESHNENKLKITVHPVWMDQKAGYCKYPGRRNGNHRRAGWRAVGQPAYANRYRYRRVAKTPSSSGVSHELHALPQTNTHASLRSYTRNIILCYYSTNCRTLYLRTLHIKNDKYHVLSNCTVDDVNTITTKVTIGNAEMGRTK